MKTLESLCVSKIMEWIFNILLQRKKSIASNWIVDISEWIQAMKLEEIHNFLMNFCIASTFDMLLSKSEEIFKEARNHDLLMCCYYLFLNEFTIKITIPTCLKMDQAHRTYLLKTIHKYSKAKKLDFQCYSDPGYIKGPEIEGW